MKAFGKAIAAMTETGRLRCEQPEFAARQFMGLLAEFGFWPRVMASGSASLPAPPQDFVTDEAIAMFMARYGGRA